MLSKQAPIGNSKSEQWWQLSQDEQVLLEKPPTPREPTNDAP